MNDLKLDDKSRYISPEEYNKEIKISDELINHPITYQRTRNYTYIKPHRISKKIQIELRGILNQKYIQSSLEEVIIIDLMRNPGGNLDDVVDMCSLFTSGNEFFSVQGRAGINPDVYGSNEPELLSNHKIVALIDNETASGAEIFAHCIKSNPNSLLLGRESAGEGSVQSIIPIDEGVNGYLILTTGHIIFLDGSELQGVGISPDYDVNFTSDPDIIIDMIDKKYFGDEAQR